MAPLVAGSRFSSHRFPQPRNRYEAMDMGVSHASRSESADHRVSAAGISLNQAHEELKFTPVCVTCESKAGASAAPYTEIYHGEFGAHTRCAPAFALLAIAFSGRSLPVLREGKSTL